MKTILTIALIISILAVPAVAQDEDSLVVMPPPKRWDVAALEVAATNALVWAAGRYILDGYWTYISLETMDINMRHGFEWDPNMFKNNFSSHPYHGNIYFNAARTNGMNFWESTPYAFAGSLTWEMFMESEFPSYNDLVMTTVGGISLGEMLYRFSEQLLDDRTGGWERFWRELGGAALNPVGGFNRLVRGDMFRRSGSVNHLRNPLYGFVALGMLGSARGADFERQRLNPAIELTMRYGDPYNGKPTRIPFDYLSLRVRSSATNLEEREIGNTTVLQHAVLFGKGLETGQDRQNTHLFGLFQHYDYVNVDFFNFGGVSLAPAFMSRLPLGSDWSLSGGLHLGWLMMGGANNEYFTNTQGRNYNYTWGFKGKLQLMLSHAKYGSLLADWQNFYMDALEGIEGRDKINWLNVIYDVRLYKHFGLGLEWVMYDRDSEYRDFPDRKDTIYGSRLLLSYWFGY